MQVLTQLGHLHWSNQSKPSGLDSVVPGPWGSSSRNVGSTLVQGAGVMFLGKEVHVLRWVINPSAKV